MEKLLEVKDLKVSFFTDLGETQAVKGAGFAIGEGDFFGIVGAVSYTHLWTYHERRTFLRPRTEVCSEIFAADEHSGSVGSFFCGDGRVHFCSYDCWPGIYLCSWSDRGRDHRLSGDPFYA